MPEAGDNYTPSRGNAEQTLTVLLAAGRLPHALLLYGERGLGKRTLCRRIAAVLLCERGPNADGPCLSCPACHKVAADTHPDVITVAHSGKQQGFSVETLRELCADAYIRPNEADYKVYILADCDSISAAAQNTLLKLLEEPPTGVFFFLTAESRAVFLPTILSRLTAVPVPPMTEADCRRALTARGFDDPAKVNEAVEAFGGNIGRCLDALEHPEALEAVQAARAIASAFAQPAGSMEYALLLALHGLEGARPLCAAALSAAAEILRDAAACKLAGPDAAALRSADKEGAKRLAPLLTLGRTVEAAGALEEAAQAAAANANQPLRLTALAMALAAPRARG